MNLKGAEVSCTTYNKMKNQNQRIKELEEDKKVIVIWTFILLGSLIFSAILLAKAADDRDEYFQQLQSCQEKVLDSTLKIKCNYLAPTGYPYSLSYEYSKLDIIKKEELKDFYLEDPKCEIIK